jgi:thiamine biosynthesis lipoprotein
MDYKKKALGYLIMGVLVIIFAFIFYSPFKKQKEYIHNEGKAQGTYYSATYLQPEGKDLQPEIEKLFKEFDLSLSTYNPNSIISKINKNDDSVKTDIYFETMFEVARKVSENTNGAFDITVAPLVNAWGFGFGNHERIKAPDVQKLLPLVGYQKIRLVNHKLIKENPEMMIDASAIAQGYSADLIAQLFEKNNCKNYMIDIGGELCVKALIPRANCGVLVLINLSTIPKIATVSFRPLSV